MVDLNSLRSAKDYLDTADLSRCYFGWGCWRTGGLSIARIPMNHDQRYRTLLDVVAAEGFVQPVGGVQLHERFF